MDDADYRNLLERVAGVRTSTALDDAGFRAVMKEFERLGFQSSRNAPQFGERDGMASTKQIAMIRSLWRQYANDSPDTEENLRRFIQAKFGVSHLRFVDGSVAHRIVGALMRMVAWRKTHPRKSAKARAAAAFEPVAADARPKTDAPPF